VRWVRVQRASALLLVVLVIAAAHVTMPSLVASKALSLAVLLVAAVHVTSSAYVVLTDQRGLAQHSRGGGRRRASRSARARSCTAARSSCARAARSRSWATSRAPSAAPATPRTSTCAGRSRSTSRAGEEPTAGCEDCHGVSVTSPKLLAVRDMKTGEQVAATAAETCLECHNPRQAEKPVWPDAIHARVKCGTCHSHVTSQDEPSWKRACQKCHPRAEDVHVDVKSLDTTYASIASKNDVHTMKCAGCHEELP
jgi:hypothetical protein